MNKRRTLETQISEPHWMQQTMKRKKIECHNTVGITRRRRDGPFIPYSCDEDMVREITHFEHTRSISNSGSSFYSSSLESQQDTNSESGSFWELIPQPDDFMSHKNQQNFSPNVIAPLQSTSPLCTPWLGENLYNSSNLHIHQKTNVSVMNENEDNDMFGVKESVSKWKTSGIKYATSRRKSRHGERMDNACFKTKTNPFFEDISGFQHSSAFEKMVFHKPQEGVLSTCALTAKDVSCGYFRLRSKASLTLESTSSITFLVLASCLTITQNNKTKVVNSGSFAYIPSDILYTLQNNTDNEVQLSYFKCIENFTSSRNE